MLNNATGFKKIYLALGYTDLRRGVEGKRLISGCTLKMYSGLHARNPEHKRFTLFYITMLLHTFVPRSQFFEFCI